MREMVQEQATFNGKDKQFNQQDASNLSLQGTPIRGGKYAAWLVTEKYPINFTLTARIAGQFSETEFKLARKLQNSQTSLI